MNIVTLLTHENGGKGKELFWEKQFFFDVYYYLRKFALSASSAFF